MIRINWYIYYLLILFIFIYRNLLSLEFKNLFESENQLLSPIKPANTSIKKDDSKKKNKKLNPLEKDRLTFDESYITKNSDIKNDDDNFSLGSSADSNDYKYQLAKLKEQTTPQKNRINGINNKSKKSISESSDSSLDDINNQLRNLKNETKPQLSQQSPHPPPPPIQTSLSQQQQQQQPPIQPPQQIAPQNNEDDSDGDNKYIPPPIPIVNKPFSPTHSVGRPFSPAHSIVASGPSTPLHASPQQQQLQASFQRNRLYRPSPVAQQQPSPPPLNQQQNVLVNDDILPFDSASLSMNNNNINNNTQNKRIFNRTDSIEFEDIEDFDF